MHVQSCFLDVLVFVTVIVSQGPSYTHRAVYNVHCGLTADYYF